MNLNEIIQAAQGGQGVANLGAQYRPDAGADAGGGAGVDAGVLDRPAEDHFGPVEPRRRARPPGERPPSGRLHRRRSRRRCGQRRRCAEPDLRHRRRSLRRSPAMPRRPPASTRKTIQQMMPALASMLLGGLAHSLTAQGFGGVLGQLAGAAQAPAAGAGAGRRTRRDCRQSWSATCSAAASRARRRRASPRPASAR